MLSVKCLALFLGSSTLSVNSSYFIMCIHSFGKQKYLNSVSICHGSRTDAGDIIADKQMWSLPSCSSVYKRRKTTSKLNIYTYPYRNTLSLNQVQLFTTQKLILERERERRQTCGQKGKLLLIRMPAIWGDGELSVPQNLPPKSLLSHVSFLREKGK